MLCVFQFQSANAQQKDSSGVSYGFILLNDETTLSGKIITADNSTVVIDDFNLGLVTLKTTQIAQIDILKNGNSYRFTMINGQIISGKVNAQTDTCIVVETESLGIIQMKPTQLKSIFNLEGQKMVNGKLWFPNPHGTRYLFMPGAIPLKKGEGYYQNVYLDVNTVTYGLTDHVSAGIGFAIPFAYMATIRTGYKVAKNIHVGGGAIYAGTFFSIGFGLGAVFANATFGNENANFTLAGGYGFSKSISDSNGVSTGWKATQYPLVTASGMLRLSNRFALVSENWLFPIRKEINNNLPFPNQGYTTKLMYDEVFSFGFRTMWERSSFDLAIATEMQYLFGNGNLPAFPYLDYVLKF